MIDSTICKIEFEVPSEEKAREIYNLFCVDNEVDFNKIDPASFHDFCEVLNREDLKDDLEAQQDYERYSNELFSGNRKFKLGELEWLGGNKAAFKYDGLWDIPYPAILAFGNKFKVPFTLKIVDTSGHYWGVQGFELDENERMRKTYERLQNRDDWYNLYLDLIGHAPPYHDLRLLLFPS